MKLWSAAALLLVLAVGRSSLPIPESIFRLRDPSILLTDQLTDIILERSFDIDIRMLTASSALKTLSRSRQNEPNVLPGLQQHGADGNYLYRLAKRESGLNPLARSSRSSAAGLYQFTSGTWLCALLAYGHHAKVSSHERIIRLPSGRCIARSKKDAIDLLALRYDPEVSTAVALPFSAHHAAVFRNTFGWPPSDRDVYVLHFFGEDAGLQFLRSVRDAPQLPAAAIAPKAARANPAIFYTKSGRPRSVYEVYVKLNL